MTNNIITMWLLSLSFLVVFSNSYIINTCSVRIVTDWKRGSFSVEKWNDGINSTVRANTIIPSIKLIRDSPTASVFSDERMFD